MWRNVVDRKQVKARAANTFVPKLNMSFARKTAALRDPEERKSLIAFSISVMGLPLLLVIVSDCESGNFKYSLISQRTIKYI